MLPLQCLNAGQIFSIFRTDQSVLFCDPGNGFISITVEPKDKNIELKVSQFWKVFLASSNNGKDEKGPCSYLVTFTTSMLTLES